MGLEHVRSRFPGLDRRVGDQPAVFFDGPAGAQVPDTVIEAVANTLGHGNSNTHAHKYPYAY